MTKTNVPALRIPAMDIIDKIDGEIKKLKGNFENYKKKTNGEFKYAPTNPSVSPIIIFKIVDLKMLITILGFLTQKKCEFDLGAEKIVNLLGIKEHPAFEWCGYSLEDWESDIVARYSALTHDERIKQLNLAKELVTKEITEEERKKKERQNTLEYLEKIGLTY